MSCARSELSGCQNEFGMGRLGRDVAERLREGDGGIDEEEIKRLGKDAALYEVTGKALERKIEQLRKEGELCSRCPH